MNFCGAAHGNAFFCSAWSAPQRSKAIKLRRAISYVQRNFNAMHGQENTIKLYGAILSQSKQISKNAAFSRLRLAVHTRKMARP